jgi:uncharacterized membrane protein
MELVLLIVVIALFAIGWKIADLAGRQGSAEEQVVTLAVLQSVLRQDLDRLSAGDRSAAESLDRLDEDLARVKAQIADLEARTAGALLASAAAPAQPAIEEPATVAAAQAVAAARPAPVPEIVAAAGPAPMIPGGRPGVARRGTAARTRRPRERQAAEPLAAVGRPTSGEIEQQPPPPSAAPPWPPEPAGPGILERAMRTLGLPSSAAEGNLSRQTLEAWLEGRMLAVVGGIALLLGAVFFLSLAFSRGWITEEMRVAIGLLAGAGLLLLGQVAFTRLRGIVGPVLVAIGLAIISLSLFAATRLYSLVPVEWALAGAFAAAVVAAAIAVRHDSQIVAGFGLIAVLVAPPVLGATPTVVTLLFVAATLVGTTAVALFRTWIWLPPVAFALAAPQIASYVLGEPPTGEALAVVVGFWLLNVIAAGGEETRHPTDRLRPATVTLLLADSAYTLWAGFAVLDGGLEPWRGTFLVTLAVLYLALGIFFLVRRGDRHPFGLVVAAMGVAVLAMAAPIAAGGPVVTIAWAAQAVALAWIAVVRRHPYGAAASIGLGALSLGHLIAVEYPPMSIVDGFARSIPFAGPEGVAFAFVIGALVVAGLVVPIAWVRAGLAVVGGLLALYVFPFELSGGALVAGWAAIATACVVLFVRVVAPRIPAGFGEQRTVILQLPQRVVGAVAVVVAGLSGVVRPAVVATAIAAVIAVAGHFVLLDYPFWMIVRGTPQEVPFVGPPGLSFAIVVLALAVSGVLVPVTWTRVVVVALGGGVALYVLPFELSGPALMWAWAAVTVAAFVLEVRVLSPRVGPAFVDPPFIRAGLARILRPSVRAVGVLAWVAMLMHLLAVDFPPGDLGTILSTPPFGGPEGLSLAAVLTALAVAGGVLDARWIRLGALGIGLAIVVYTVSLEITQPAVTAAWALLLLAALAVVRRLAAVPLVPAGRLLAVEPVAERLPYAAAGLALAFIVARAVVLADPQSLLGHLAGSELLAETPFVDERTFVLLVLAATIAVAGWIWGGIAPRLWTAVVAALVLAWLIPFEVPAGYAVAGWSALALAGLGLLRAIPEVPTAREVLAGTALGLFVVGSAVALVVAAPPDRLVVDASTVVPRWGILTEATVALGSLAIALAVGALLHRGQRLTMAGLVAAGVTFVYLASVAVVDAFQVQVETQPLKDLQEAAQVGLSVLWSVLGGACFAAGLLMRLAPVRLFGLALLGLASAKVFLIDLAALDVAYRVLSLVALGALLIISAVVYQRMQHPHGPVGSHRA